MKSPIKLPDSPHILVGTATVATLTCAGLLWLHQSSALSTTGERIFELDQERQALLERRAEALVAYAAATDPVRLEARARALGFGPTRDVTALVVDPSPDSAVASGVPDGSPLGITGLPGAPVQAQAPSLTERILAIGLNEASADARTAPVGNGSAP